MAGNAERGHQAVLDAARAIEAAGLGLRTWAKSHAVADLVIAAPGGPKQAVAIAHLSRADPSRVRSLVDGGGHGGAIMMLVADEIPVAARQMLSRAGWAWLDRRGHLRLTAPGVAIDTEVEAFETLRSRPTEAVRGVSGISYAAALLMAPDDPPSIREVARRSKLSASTV